jgi:hypothetical protein
VENPTTQRRHRRVQISGIATLNLKEKGKMRSIQTVIANISSGGIGLYSYNSMEINKCVSITVNFISGDGMLKTDQFNEEINAKHQPSVFEHVQTIPTQNQ